MVGRLSVYLRQLESLLDEGTARVSSSRLAELSAVKATQLRKDLSHFGSFGVRGLGYEISELAAEIKAILGLDRKWNAVLFGAGSLGHALAGYRGFARHNIEIRAILDSDSRKIGKRVANIVVEDVARIDDVRKSTGAQIAVVAVPALAAPELAERIVKAGFRGIVNFAPVRLRLPPDVVLYSVDLATAFENVTFRFRNAPA